MTRFEKTALLCILLVAAVARLWDFPSYFPLYWDEAKYIAEIERFIPFFSVNAGSFAFLKLGYGIFGQPSYPQLVAALFGTLTVLGLFLVGGRILKEKRPGVLLGLVMAGQAALMPYYLIYSRQALATIFALCFFVYALYIYLGRLAHPVVKNAAEQKRYLTRAVLPATGLLAMVPACSFKFLLPTAMLFALLEVYLWRVRRKRPSEFKPFQSMLISLFCGSVLFAVLPPLMAAVSGYDGWLERAITLSRFHGEIRTLRLAGHFLYPLHLYYLAGPAVILCALGGAILLVSKWKPKRFAIARSPAGLLLAGSFVVYFLFYGLLSHLQSARLHALTLPFIVFLAAFFLCGLRHLLPRLGKAAFLVGCVLVTISLGYLSVDYLTCSSNLKEATRVVMENTNPETTIRSNAKVQVIYGVHNSAKATGKKILTYGVKSFLATGELKLDPTNPPVILLQDGIDIVSTIAHFNKSDDLRPLDTMQLRVTQYRKVEPISDLLYAAEADIFTTPYYYLEDIYSWQAYNYIRQTLPRARDSVFVYIINPTKLRVAAEANQL